MKVLKITGDIDINLDLPKGSEITEVKLDDYIAAEYDHKFDMIICVHALQTLWTDQVSSTVDKLVSDLASMGELHIHVPATEQAVKAMLQGVQDPVAFYMVWGTKNRPFHTGFNLLWLRVLVEQAGAIIRTATMGKFKLTSGNQEAAAIEHIIIATVIRS